MFTKKIITFSSVLLLGVLSVGCGGDKEVIKEKPKPPKKEDKSATPPKWNKANTATMYFVSKFNEKPLSKNNYSEVSAFLKNKQFQVTVIDRSDVELDKNFNGGITVVNALKKYSIYNLLEIEAKKIKGSTIIFNNPLKKHNTYKINANCRLTETEVLLKKGINIPLAITTFSDENQIQEGKKIISRMISNNKVMLLKLKPNLVETFKKIAVEVNKNYRVQEFSTQKEYSIIIVCPKYWLPRKVEKVTSLSNGLEIYNLQIEANVFY